MKFLMMTMIFGLMVATTGAVSASASASDLARDLFQQQVTDRQ